MRNAGDRAPGGSGGRRQRGASPETSSRAGGNGGASLFTPAYRVSHAGRAARTAGTGHDADDSGYVTADDRRRDGAGQSAAGYGWSEGTASRPDAGYRRGDPDGDGGEPLWPGDADRSTGYGHAPDEDSWPDSGANWARPAAPELSRALRGFPPAPGEPLPVYPPGPFAAWNRSAAGRDAQRGRGQTPTDTAPGIAAATITPDEFDTNHSLPAIKDPSPGSAARSGGRTAVADRARTREHGGQPAASQGGTRQSRGGGARGDRSDRGERSGRGGRSRRRAAGRAAARRQPAWLAIAFAIAIIAAGTVVLVLTTRSTPPGRPKANGAPTPAVSSTAPPAGRWEYIGSRKTDSMPVTTQELYPPGVRNGSTDYTKVKQAQSGDCGAALIGSALKSAVKQGVCTEAVRATYIAHPGGMMATIGVFNLDSAAAAGQAATKAGHFNFVAQLQSKSGPASKIGQGTGIEEAVVKGHYLVLVWAEYTSLNAPSSQAGRSRLDTFMNVLIAKTANVGLRYRMVYGKPSVRPAG